MSDIEERLRAWMVANMPAGTVIGDPEWWATRIAKVAEIERLEARVASLIRDCAEADGRIAEIASERDALKARVAEL